MVRSLPPYFMLRIGGTDEEGKQGVCFMLIDDGREGGGRGMLGVEVADCPSLLPSFCKERT